jgi:preprotein translocase subunit SecG
MLHTVLIGVQLISCALIISLVLIQRGKGADAGAGFGAGASGTVFGARGASTALSRATAILAAVFMVNSLMLSYLGTKGPIEQPKSILDEAALRRTAPAGSGSGNTPIPTSPPAPTSSAPVVVPSITPAPVPSSAPAAPAGPSSNQTTGQAPPAPAPAAPAAPTK